MSNNKRSAILEAVANKYLRPEQSMRMDCPNCSGKNTLSVSNKLGTIVWYCFKASCDLKGASKKDIPSDWIKSFLSNQKSETSQIRQNSYHYYGEDLAEYVPPSYCVPLDHLDKRAFTYQSAVKILSKYEIHDDGNLRVDVKEDRLVFPVRCYGKTVDAVGRWLGLNPNYKGPKWKRYNSSGLPYVHWKPQNLTKLTTVVIVEDAISAAVVSEHFRDAIGLALLGTNLTAPTKQYITHLCNVRASPSLSGDSRTSDNRKIIVALDPDASMNTLSMSKVLTGVAAKVHCLYLTDDLKYRKSLDMFRLQEMINLT